MNKLMLRSLCFVLFCVVFKPTTKAQSLKLKILAADSKEPLIGACVLIQANGVGDCSDIDGSITINELPKLPFKASVSYLGYQTQELNIKSLAKEITVNLEAGSIDLDAVEIASEYSKLKQELSLTVESLSLEDIRATSESSFYESLAAMREVDMMTVSFGVKVVNTRGFNSSTPIRSLQLIDGVDNASPGLNYPLGNFMGLPELDVQGVDLVIGASSSHFGPGAFNGVVNMRTKNPYDYPGLEAQIKTGERSFLETALRYAHAFKNKKGKKTLGVKFNISYSEVYDWEANDTNPSIDALKDSISADNPGGYDAVNRYGDEINANFGTLFEQFRHPGLGRFYRTGYWEKDLTEYDSYNLKASVALHYRFGKDWEILGTTHYGEGTTVMQLDNRLNLNGVWAVQNKFEIKKKDRFFFRAYRTREDAGNTFDIVSTASILQNRARGNQEWTNDYKSYWFRNINPQVKELPNFPVIGPPPDFFYDFEGAQNILNANSEQVQAWHNQTRNAVDGGRFVPGTPEFEEVYQDIISTKVSEGGTKYVDESKLYHFHTEYSFPTPIFDEVTIGGNLRLYRPYSEGTIFVDTSGTDVKTYEYGAYIGLNKILMNNRLKLDIAARLDKHENYDYLISPSLSLNYKINALQSMRFSLSSALRNPTLIEQYYYFRVGQAILLGNITGYDNLITLDSFEEYLDNGLDANLLEYFSEPPIKPEKALATEIAYSGVFFDNKLDLNSTLYLNRYEDFIGFKIGLNVPFFQGFPGIPVIYRFSANAEDITYTTGFSLGLNYFLSRNVTLNGNYSWNRIFQSSDDPLIPAYNTPEHKFNLGLSLRELVIANTKNWSAGASFRWVESYTFESSPQFTGIIPAQVYVNAQISKGFPKIKSTLKLSGSNLLNRQQNGLYGGPAVGRFVFLSWYFSTN